MPIFRKLGNVRIKNRRDFMSKKNTMKKVVALLMGVALTAGATSCNFVLTDSEKDLQQTVATVNIKDTLAEDANYKDFASAVNEIIGTAEIYKSDLISYYLSVGYQYVENYGYSMKDTINMLLDGLVSREIMIQYAVAYYLKRDKDKTDGLSQAGHDAFVNGILDGLKDSQDEQEKKLYDLYKAHPEVLTYKYFLEQEEFDRTEYNLKKSLNSSLDSLEKEIIKAEDETATKEEPRTLPTGVATEKEDYYTLDYDVYTGLNNLDSCGAYEKVKGSTKGTRSDAYNKFLANLQTYGLIKVKGSNPENITYVTLLDYYYVELASALGQALINQYFEDLEDEVVAKVKTDYIQDKYEAIYEQQAHTYKMNPSAFLTAMDSVSDSNFLLYGLRDFGYVYNILIPFSATQNIKYAEAKAQGLTTDELYLARKEILKKVEGEDQRGTWFSTNDADNYSYEKDGKYYFFEEYIGDSDRYESLKLYAGNYAYNGKVKIKDDEYVCTPNKANVDKVLDDMLDLIKKTGATVVEDTNTKKAYNAVTTYKDAEDEIDFSRFIYRQGQVDLGSNASASDFFVKDTTAYKVASAVNEIMFAYSTDPGCLNTYLGYAVSPYDTNFVDEFEYTAQELVKKGPGSYAVCATDYGWHIMYCTFKYDGCDTCANGGDCGKVICGGDVYGGYDANAKETEGSFSELFYESLKESMIGTATSELQNMVLNQFNNAKSVKKFQKTYQDLLDIE